MNNYKDEVVDTTNYEYVNAILSRFSIDSNTRKVEMFTNKDYHDEYYLRGYKLYTPENEYVGCVFFGYSSKPDISTSVLFNSEGVLIDYENSKKHLDNSLINGLGKYSDMFFDKENESFHVFIKINDVTWQTEIEQGSRINILETDEQGYTRYKQFPLISETSSEDKDKILDRLIQNGLRIKRESFITISENEITNIEISSRDTLNEKILPKPVGGLWGSFPSSDENYVSEWHEFCVKEEFGLEKLNFATEFSLKENSKVLCLDSEEDLASLALCYPSSTISADMLSYLEMANDYNDVFSQSLFIDWDRLAKDYDAVIVTSYISLWDVPSVVVFNADAVENFRSVSIDEYLLEKLVDSVESEHEIEDLEK